MKLKMRILCLLWRLLLNSLLPCHRLPPQLFTIKKVLLILSPSVYPVKPQMPAVGGYEGVGEVHSLGSAVKGLSPGDLVIPCPPSFGAVKDLNFYRCFGRLLALALMHKIQIGITLDKTLFQQFAENDINLEDIRETAPGMFRSLSEIILSSEEGFKYYPLYYPDSPDRKKKRDKLVAYEDREEYLVTKIREQFVDSIKSQTEKIIEGVDDIISCPKRT